MGQIVSSRELDHHAAAVRKASDSAPVFITVHGVLKTVMLSYDSYRQLEKNAHRRTLLEAFSMPGFKEMKTDVDLESFSPRQKGIAATFN